MKKYFISIFRNIIIFIKWLFEEPKQDVMCIQYDLTENKIECTGWYGQKISRFSGKFSSELWNEIKPYCRANEDYPPVPTRIYIWAGMENKHLAYCEPVRNYLNDELLLKTGQGFHYKSGIRYGASEKLKCSHCGQYLKNE